MTSSSRPERGEGIASSLRLRTLHSYYQNEEMIWDIGCDHGILGSSFAGYDQVKEIHLVDPSLSVYLKLKDSYITKPKFFIHHQEGQDLLISSRHNLIFIAGMGGKEIGDILLHLMPQLDQTSRIVISPHRKILELRELLHGLPLGLLEERVIKENDQFYQIIGLGLDQNGPKVPLYGEAIFQSETGEEYRQHQIKAFRPHKDLASREYVSYLEGAKFLKTTTK